MPEKSVSHKRKKDFTRRDFNKLASIVVAFQLGLRGLVYFLDRATEDAPVINPTKIPTLAGEAPSDELGLEFLIDDIKKYRKTFQLPGLPSELSDENITLARQVDWEKPSNNFIPDMDDIDASYGKRFEDILKTILGENYSRLIFGITDKGPPGTSGISGNIFRLTVSNLHGTYPIEGDSLNGNFTDLSLHESHHQLNPRQHAGLYPLDKLVRISHGYWRALTRAFAVEGQFYHHPSDQMLAVMQKRIGEIVAKSYTQDAYLINVVDTVGHAKIIEMLAPIAREKGVDVRKVKFTKKVLLEFGKKLVPEILAGNIHLQGEALNSFVTQLEDNFVEISAEMFRLAIFHPDLIKHDGEIMAGIEEMLSAINSKPVKLEDIRQKLLEVDPVTVEKFKQEVSLIEALKLANEVSFQSTPVPNATAVSEDLQKLQDQDAEQKAHQKKFDDYVKSGALPEDLIKSLSETDKEVLYRYGSYVVLIYSRYPMIFEAKDKSNMSFDPDLNAWESNEIAEAVNQDEIWNVIGDPKVAKDQISWFEKRIPILENFINNAAAFGTNNFKP